MGIKKRLKKVEKQLKEISSRVERHAGAIVDLKHEVNGNGDPFSMTSHMMRAFVTGSGPKTKSRIDRAHMGVSDVRQRLDTLCKSLGVTIRGKEDMPDFEIVKKGKKGKEAK